MLSDPFFSAKIYAILIWFIILFVLERLKSASGHTPPLGDTSHIIRIGRNLGLWAINSGLSPLIILPLTIWASTQAIGWRPDWLQGPSSLLLDLVILDLWIYWWHRANHEFPLLWRFHRIHHLDEHLDATSAVRFHFGEVILSALVRAAVIILLDIPLTSVIIFETVVLIAALFHHSDIVIPKSVENALSLIIITPSIHWIHHHAERADTDSNYGTMLSIWDRLFGSRRKTARSPEIIIGVENELDLPLWQLLASPAKEFSRKTTAS